MPSLIQHIFCLPDFVYIPIMASNVQQTAQAAASSPDVPEQQQQPQQQQKKQTWSEYGKQVYNQQYERWMPWIEDFYLRWFTKDNKASYATKGASQLYHVGEQKKNTTRLIYFLHHLPQIPSPKPKSQATSKSITSKTARTTSSSVKSARTACCSPSATPFPRRASTAPSAVARTTKGATRRALRGRW